MTIVQCLRLEDEQDEAEAAIGTQLRDWCHRHAYEIAGTGVGIAFAACWAAIAVQGDRGEAANDPEYAEIENVGLIKARHGCSRMYQGMDPAVKKPRKGPFSSSEKGEHAEQSAIICANGKVVLFVHGGHYHLYVMLRPCQNCYDWVARHPSPWYVHYGFELTKEGKQGMERDVRAGRRDVLKEAKDKE